MLIPVYTHIKFTYTHNGSSLGHTGGYNKLVVGTEVRGIDRDEFEILVKYAKKNFDSELLESCVERKFTASTIQGNTQLKYYQITNKT